MGGKPSCLFVAPDLMEELFCQGHFYQETKNVGLEINAIRTFLRLACSAITPTINVFLIILAPSDETITVFHYEC
jgi:hypothetical protein